MPTSISHPLKVICEALIKPNNTTVSQLLKAYRQLARSFSDDHPDFQNKVKRLETTAELHDHKGSVVKALVNAIERFGQQPDVSSAGPSLEDAAKAMKDHFEVSLLAIHVTTCISRIPALAKLINRTYA